MRALTMNSKMEETRRRQKEEKMKKVTPKSLEWKRLKRKYPNSKFKLLMVRDVPLKLQKEFQRKCELEECTMSGKVRRLIIDLLDGKIEDIKIQQRMGPKEFLAVSNPKRKDKASAMSFCRIPEEEYKRFHQWCSARGLSLTWKTKQLIYWSVMGYIQ